MPKDYVAVRDSCIERKKKKKGEVSDKDVKDCKRMAAIWYYKKHGKPVQHSDAKELGLDDIEIAILNEQIEIFGDLDNYESWQQE